MYRLHKRTFTPGLFELEMAGACDPGLARSHNEDAIALQDDDGRGYYYGLVCDGMGGYNAGELASATAIHTVAEVLELNFPSEDLEGLAQLAFRTASQRIDELADLNTEAQGMGCTAVLALGQRERLLIAHVGDSRAYLHDASGLQQITKDHTMIQEMLDADLITPGQAASHPYAGRISRCLGHGKNRDTASFVWLELAPEQTILLCSDGLCDVVPEAEIADILRQHATRDATRVLMQAANRYGGPDNISAVLLRRIV